MSIKSKTIVFVTGCCISHVCWNEWERYFDARGYNTLAPPWPGRDKTPEELRSQHPFSTIAENRLNEVIQHFENIIRKLSEKPILIGHCMGGLITQVLVTRKLAAAGIMIHSVPPGGIIIYEYTVLRAAWKSLGLFTSLRKSYLMSFKDWQYAFTNGMQATEQLEAYERYAIPESKRLIRDALMESAQVDFDKRHVPILFIAGSGDHTMPASINMRNFNKYKKNGSITEYHCFEGHNHFVIGEPTWTKAAAFILNWLNVTND